MYNYILIVVKKRTRGWYLLIFRGTATGKIGYCATVLFCFAVVLNTDGLIHFKHNVFIFIHGTSKMESFVICKISLVNLMIPVSVHM